MIDKPTLCVECDLVHPDTVTKEPFRWRCMASPAPNLGGYVDPNYRPNPPYYRCESVNDGQCPYWTMKRRNSDNAAPQAI